MSFFDSLLWPIMVAVAWIMVQFHTLLTSLGLDTDSGASWALSIVGLVIVIRIVLIPLFVKQIKASRGLQMIQPQMQKLQAKYKGKTDPASRQAMQAEMMQMYREAGTNPFASCLPILAQSPIFFALFRVLYSLPAVALGPDAEGGMRPIGPLTAELAASAEQSTIFGAPLAATFIRAADYPDPGVVRIVTIVLIILMSATTFYTQRQLTMKNMPAAALDNPMARQQKMLMYLLPVIFAVSGVNFPIGVLLYWFTTNLWSMGQQFYVIRNMPAPGSAAEEALRARRAKRAARRGKPIEPEATPEVVDDQKGSGQRQQPVRKDRQRAPRPTGSAPPAKPGGKASATPAGKSGKPGQAGQRTTASGQAAPRPRPAQGQGAKPGAAKGQATRPPAGKGQSTKPPKGQAPKDAAGRSGGKAQSPGRRPPAPGGPAPGRAGSGTGRAAPHDSREPIQDTVAPADDVPQTPQDTPSSPDARHPDDGGRTAG